MPHPAGRAQANEPTCSQDGAAPKRCQALPEKLVQGLASRALDVRSDVSKSHLLCEILPAGLEIASSSACPRLVFHPDRLLRAHLHLSPLARDICRSRRSRNLTRPRTATLVGSSQRKDHVAVSGSELVGGLPEGGYEEPIGVPELPAGPGGDRVEERRESASAVWDDGEEAGSGSPRLPAAGLRFSTGAPRSPFRPPEGCRAHGLSRRPQGDASSRGEERGEGFCGGVAEAVEFLSRDEVLGDSPDSPRPFRASSSREPP
jgi:hypothetical protein